MTKQAKKKTTAEKHEAVLENVDAMLDAHRQHSKHQATNHQRILNALLAIALIISVLIGLLVIYS